MAMKGNNQPENPMMYLMSKRTGLKTSSEQMTMFSRKLEGSRNKQMKIPIDIHI